MRPILLVLVVRSTSIILLVGELLIKNNEGLFKVTCYMKLKSGGLKGGWKQVADVDNWITNP